MPNRLADKVALVLAAGSGYGEQIARRFAQAGCAVAVVDTNDTSGKRVVQAIKAADGRAEYLYGDPTDHDDMPTLVAAGIEAFGHIDICVNALASAHRNGDLLDLTEPDFDRLLIANAKSLYLSAQLLVPHFRAQGSGCFVQIAAATGVHPRAGLTWFSGSMGGVIATCKAMAVDLGRDGIRVNVVNPLPDDTDPRGEYVGAADTPEQRARLKAAVPLARLPSALDVANAALFLASDEARCITGACLDVDGGYGL